MEKQDLSELNYGDRIVVKYRTKDDDSRVKFPEIQQDIGYLIECDDEVLELARHNPVLAGKYEDLPGRMDYVIDPSDNAMRWNKRSLLLSNAFYPLEEIVEVEKV